MRTLILQKIIRVSSCQRVPSHDAYTVDIAGRSFPLRVPVAAVPNSFKRLLDVGIDTGGLGKVKLVPVAVRILAASVAGLRPTSDSEATLACFLQCNSALDGGFSDPFVGSAMRIVLVSAAAAGPRLNPSSFEARRSLRLGKSLGANYGGHDNSNDSKELGTVSRGRAQAGRRERTNLHVEIRVSLLADTNKTHHEKIQKGGESLYK